MRGLHRNSAVLNGEDLLQVFPRIHLNNWEQIISLIQ